LVSISLSSLFFHNVIWCRIGLNANRRLNFPDDECGQAAR